MRVFGVSVISLSLLAALAPLSTVATSRRSIGALKQRLRHVPVENPPSAIAKRVGDLVASEQYQAAIEYYLETLFDDEDTPDDLPEMYNEAMKKFVTFVAAPGVDWDSLTDVEKVRAMWTTDDRNGLIALYERSEACKADPRAKAAYKDAKLCNAVKYVCDDFWRK